MVEPFSLMLIIPVIATIIVGLSIVAGCWLIRRLALPTDPPDELRYEPQPPAVHQEKDQARERASVLHAAYELAAIKRKIEDGLQQLRDELSFLSQLEDQTVLPNELSKATLCKNYQATISTIEQAYDSKTATLDDCQQVIPTLTDFIAQHQALRDYFQPHSLRAWVMLAAVICCVMYLIMMILG